MAATTRIVGPTHSRMPTQKKEQQARGFWSVLLGFLLVAALAELTRPLGWWLPARMVFLVIAGGLITVALYKLFQRLQQRLRL